MVFEAASIHNTLCIPLYCPISLHFHEHYQPRRKSSLCYVCACVVLCARSNHSLGAGSLNTTNPSINQADTTLLSTARAIGLYAHIQMHTELIKSSLCCLEEWMILTDNFIISSTAAWSMDPLKTCSTSSVRTYTCMWTIFKGRTVLCNYTGFKHNLQQFLKQLTRRLLCRFQFYTLMEVILVIRDSF